MASILVNLNPWDKDKDKIKNYHKWEWVNNNFNKPRGDKSPAIKRFPNNLLDDKVVRRNGLMLEERTGGDTNLNNHPEIPPNVDTEE
jgi:hypothetical protein